YELFRQFHGRRRFRKGEDSPFGAVVGVLHSLLQMLETGATHLGVATDHVIESFRNDLWPGYKTSAGVDPRLLAQFGLPAEALGERSRELALLFKDLATLRSQTALFAGVDELRWRGPAEAFAAWAERLGDDRLPDRAAAAACN